MGFDKSLTVTSKFIIIFCASYIHTSLHAQAKKQTEPNIVEQIDVIYKNAENNYQKSKVKKVNLEKREKTFTVSDILAVKPAKLLNLPVNVIAQSKAKAKDINLVSSQNGELNRTSDQRVSVEILLSPKNEQTEISAEDQAALNAKVAAEKKTRNEALQYRKKGSKLCNSEGCVEIVFGPSKNYEIPLGILTPIRVVAYDSDNNFSYEDRYYGWDMNRDSKIDMIEKLDDENQVIAREYDFTFDGLRNYTR